MSRILAPTELVLNPDGSLYHCNLLPENIAGFRDAFVFTGVGLLLLFRPQGIIGQRPDFGEKS